MSLYTTLEFMNGNNMMALSDSERLFGVFAILIGSVMIATIYGNVTLILLNFSSDRAAYQQKMESL
jgi:hypothetical protein